MDELFVVTIVDFFPQIADVDVDYVGAALLVKVPYVILNHFA